MKKGSTESPLRPVHTRVATTPAFALPLGNPEGLCPRRRLVWCATGHLCNAAAQRCREGNDCIQRYSVDRPINDNWSAMDEDLCGKG